ncbi:chitinase 2-like protein [Tanacetum coccineum]
MANSTCGDSVNGENCYFSPLSVDSWVANAVSSLIAIIQEYNLDGIDIDYEHFHADADTVITWLFGKAMVMSNYGGGSILASFISDGSGGLSPQNGFFTVCSRLKSQGRLGGIIVWSADDSKALAANSNLLREYIGAESDSVKLTDMPINSKVEVHYILAFAIDYTSDNRPSPTNNSTFSGKLTIWVLHK